jgi:oxygen-independent coproporphyrinogen-3 oxidase
MTHAPTLPPSNPPTHAFSGGGLYLHVPFCVRKCPYCAFASIPSAGAQHAAYVEAVCREIREAPQRLAVLVGSEEAARRATDPAETVFFGGGTPTLLATDQLKQILDGCRAVFPWSRGGSPDPPGNDRSGHSGHSAPMPEITLEANPGAVDHGKLAVLREAGFNRLSLGAQSFRDDALAALGRIHSVREIHDAVRAARAAGFANLSLDLIFGLPGQSLAQWESDLHAAAATGAEHLSCYLLTVEPNTPLDDAVRRGAVTPLDDELQKDMLLAAADLLPALGYARYEISNYAKPGFECRHNVKYWTGAPYLGFGPAAHSFLPRRGRGMSRLRSSAIRSKSGLPRSAPVGAEQPSPANPPWGVRWSNVSAVDAYLRRVQAGDSPVAMREDLTREQRMFETIFLGLRMARGVDLDAFAREFEEDVDARHGAAARRLADQGLIERAGGFLRLTRDGLPVTDAVTAEFSAEGRVSNSS